MSYFAKIDKQTNIVIDVISATRLFIYSLEDSEDWIQTSYNNTGNKKYAAIGDIYDREKDLFYRPKPFESYIFDENGSLWKPPFEKTDQTQILTAWDDKNQRYVPHYSAEDVKNGNVPDWYMDKVNGVIGIDNIEEIPTIE